MNSSTTPLRPLKMHKCILHVQVFLLSDLTVRLFSSQNFIVPPNFIGPLSLVFLLSQHHSSSVLLLPLHIDHSLFSPSPSLYSSPQCSSHYLLPTTAPHPLCSLLHFSFLNFLLSSASCVFVLLCHFQQHFVLVIQSSSALHCKSVNTNSRSQLSVSTQI